MHLFVLDPDLKAVDVIDSYQSVIWTDRYALCGDFELHLPVDSITFNTLREDYYLWIAESNHVMIIETRQIKSDVDTGVKMVFTGRSLESILERRIIWNPTEIKGNLQLGIKKLLDENVISPTIASRKINNVRFKMSEDPRITELTIEDFFLGENLYEIICILCDIYDIGFRIQLVDDQWFDFELYMGQDRSYQQQENPYVIFSPRFENLLSSEFFESHQQAKNIALVEGEAQRITVGKEYYTGLDRRELYTDVTHELDPAQLELKGLEGLSEATPIRIFEGQAETNRMFVFGESFFIGDIVQIQNEYGLEDRVRVTEFVRSEDPSGIYTYPTFDAMPKNIEPYIGPYVVDPSAHGEKILLTRDKFMLDNVTVNEVKYQTSGSPVTGQTVNIAKED